MSVTDVYGRVHWLLAAYARVNAIVPADVRLLVALHERGGRGTSDELWREMATNATAVRRSSITLRNRGLVVASAADGSVRPKRGTLLQLDLTENGRSIAQMVLADLAADEDSHAVAA
jgi:DNA-binding IclR family transcriptional regulator